MSGRSAVSASWYRRLRTAATGSVVSESMIYAPSRDKLARARRYCTRCRQSRAEVVFDTIGDYAKRQHLDLIDLILLSPAVSERCLENQQSPLKPLSILCVDA